MLIDWFTVAAQVINFLILVWLMKRFLYRPILHAIDEREQKIAAELADADAKRVEAKQERDDFAQKNADLDRQRADLINKAKNEAETLRKQLCDKARQAADDLLAKRQESLKADSRNLNHEDGIGVVLLGDYSQLRAGDEVRRTKRVMDVAVGDRLLGRVVDPLGRPLDGKGLIHCDKRLPIERPAPPIMDRSQVTVPLQTGIKSIDALIPIGRGQRELILGDRQTGKTAIAIDTSTSGLGRSGQGI